MTDYDLEILTDTLTLEIIPEAGFEMETFTEPVTLELQSPEGVSLDIHSTPAIFIDTGVGHTHIQNTSQSSWTVNHNLGYYPIVTVLSPGGVEVIAAIQHTSKNQFIVNFTEPNAGQVISR